MMLKLQLRFRICVNSRTCAQILIEIDVSPSYPEENHHAILKGMKTVNNPNYMPYIYMYFTCTVYVLFIFYLLIIS